MAATNNSLGALDNLPAEIRNLIYTYALTTTSAIEISRQRVRQTTPVKRSLEPVYTAKSKVETWHGKRKRKPAAAKVLAIHILRASKQVNKEATSILYAHNHFSFEEGRAIRAFMTMIGERTAFLENVVFHAHHGPAVDLFNRLAKPRSLTIHVGLSHHTAVWECVKHIFQTRRFSDLDWENLVIELPLELQLERFEEVKFVVRADTEFHVDGQMVKVQDQEERGRRYKGRIARLLVEEGEDARDAKKKEGEVISEMLMAHRSVRQLEG